MKIDILTIFPEMFAGPFDHSIVKRAREQGSVDIQIHNLRDWTEDKHKTVDDKPYGGEAGMVLMVEPIHKAIKTLKSKYQKSNQIQNPKSKIQNQTQVILLSPQGEKYSQQKAQHLSEQDHLILIAGHYEGFDQRIRDHLIDDEISVGDYVLTGGELPAMIIIDSIVRLIPGVLGDDQSLVGETHSVTGHIKHPVYTRPENYNGWQVPKILLSGNHAEIDKWQQKNSRLKKADD